MEKNGFTLVELLAVIVVLAIISLITVPVIIKIISNAENNTYEKQVQTIEQSAEKWSVKQSLPTEDGSFIYVDLKSLKEEGYLKDEPIINPISNQEMIGRVKITYDIEYNQYEYEYQEN